MVQANGAHQVTLTAAFVTRFAVTKT